MKSNDNIEQANRRARELQSHAPRVVSARYDTKAGRIVISAHTKLVVSFAPEDAQGLENAGPSQLCEIEIPGLLEGFLGSKSWMAPRLGQIGGEATSKAEQAASRANGRLRGRLRKALQR